MAGETDGQIGGGFDFAALAAEMAARQPRTRDLERQLGLTGRHAAQGAAGLVGLVYDPLAALQNAAIGPEGLVPLLPEVAPLREQVSRALTELGVPEPETATERIIGAMSEGLVGAGLQLAPVRMAANAASGVAGRVWQDLASGPVQQLAGGTAAGGGAQAVAESGGGFGAQLGAALLAGGLGARAAGLTATERLPLPPAAQAAERAGIPVMTSDVLPPNTFASRWIQRTGEMIPIAGTGGPRAAQQEARANAVRDLLANFGVEELPAANSSLFQGIVRDMAGARRSALNEYATLKSNVIERLSGAGPVPVDRTVEAIQREIERLNAASPNGQFRPIIDILQTWADDLTGTRDVRGPAGQTVRASTGQTLDNIEILRAQIGQSFSDFSLASMRNEGEKALSRIYGPLREDMGDFIRQNGERRDYDRWMIANRRLSDLAGDLSVNALRNAFRTGEETPEVVASLLFSARPSDVRRLYMQLTPEGRALARTAVLQRAFDNIGGRFEDVSPDRFKQQVERLGTSINVMFSGDDLRAVDGLARALRLTARAGQASVSPPTGIQAVPVAGAAVLTDLLGGAGAALASGATLGGLARVYESRAVRNALLGLAGTRNDSREEAALFNRLIQAIRAERGARE